jgi:hypothetical protein
VSTWIYGTDEAALKAVSEAAYAQWNRSEAEQERERAVCDAADRRYQAGYAYACGYYD